MKPAHTNQLVAALLVARWEFARHFKPRQQLIGLLILAMMGVAFLGVMRRSAGSPPPVADVAVLAAPGISLPDEIEGVRFTTNPAGGASRLLDLLEQGEIDGVLQLNPDYSGELTVKRERAWVRSLQGALSELKRGAVSERERISVATMKELLAPAALDVVVRDGGGAGGRFSFIFAGALMMIAIIAGMSTIFVSITGEKQIRVTEQVLSAIPPQAWMDGKILGIAAMSIAQVLITGGGALLVGLVLHRAGVSVPIPFALGNIGILIYLALFAVLGSLFWLSFLAAVAAIIADPQHSARGGLMVLPLACSALALFALRDADSTLVRTLALLPLTAPTSMPARLILADVNPLDPVLALVLLAASTFAMRLAAGRIFRTAMLMYGKDPSWREIKRWVIQR